MFKPHAKQTYPSGLRACDYRIAGHEFTPGDIAETLLILYFEFTQQLAIAPADLSLSGSELRKHLCTIQNLYQAMRSLENSGQIATPIEES